MSRARVWCARETPLPSYLPFERQSFAKFTAARKRITNNDRRGFSIGDPLFDAIFRYGRHPEGSPFSELSHAVPVT